ncbi:MAG: chitobiase/beta-hexosaminidase C-terminal domain-containing protein, partial [Candidatus Cloacimonadaceae bacterium]|nr:chitobiase/beta-hexosaminidase C-terminal domain-containing protein [Candidatus Cloacimonadaceae bacterium]
MKKAFVLLIVLMAATLISADAKRFLNMREVQITPEVLEQVMQNNQLVRGPSFNFSSTPYNLPDAVDIADPLTGRFYEDVPWIKDFTRHIVNPGGGTLYLYHSTPEHFIITQPDPGNPLKLRFQPIPQQWFGTELMVITVSDEPLSRTDRAMATAIIRLNVTSVPDPPVFHNLPAGNIFYTDEDVSFSRNFQDYVYCIDSAPTNFDLFVAQTQFTLPYNVATTQSPGVNGHNVLFSPRRDFNGTQSFLVTAVDRLSSGFSTQEIHVVVLPQNDPPEILSYSPPQGTITVNQDQNVLFNVNVIDIDGNALTHTWTLSGTFNGVPFSNVVSTSSSLDYLFSIPGTYNLVYSVTDGWETVTLQWTIIVSPIGPIFTPWGATFDHGISVLLSSPPGYEGATIYFTLDGSIPTSSSAVYSQPIALPALPNIENIKTIKAFFIHPSYPQSQVVSSTYRITGRVADPVFNPVGGLYYSQTSVNITSANLSAQIYYTTNGSDPVPGNPGTFLYTVPIVVPAQSTRIIKAIAIRTGWISSNIITHTYIVTGVVTINSYTLNPPPPPAGEYYTVEYGRFIPLTIEALSITPPSAVLWYTLDNSVPGPSNPNSLIYTTGTVIELTNPTWVTFRAYNPDWLPSTTYSFYYDVRARTYIEFFANGTIFNPAPGSSTVPIFVSINTVTVPLGASIYYTTDGTDPVANPALLYTGQISITQTKTIKVLAQYPDICPSQIYVGVFEITGRVDTPVFDPPPSSYFNSISLSMSTILPGTRIFYTLNGADPLPTDISPDSYEFLGPFILGTGQHHIRARAYKVNWEPSFIREGYYSIGVLPQPIFNLVGGLYFDPIVVRLSVPSVPTASIHYTTDGSVPTTASTLYNDAIGIPIGLETSMVIKAIAWQGGWTQSDVATRTYQVTGTVVSPVFVPGGGDYPSAVNVSISTSTSGANIKYTLDGLDPTASYGIDYIGPVSIASSSTLKARAFLADWRPSLVNVAEYTIFGNIANPVFTPGPGTYTSAVNVYISVNPPDAMIYYTTDGSVPSEINGIAYLPGTPILIGSNTMIRAIAIKPGWNPSSVVNGQYFITGTVSTPSFNPLSGQYAGAQTVTITTATPSATIIYTTDGTEPSRTNGLVYTGSLNISTSAIIKAFAYLAGWNDSQVATASYVINGAIGHPVFSPSGGYYNSIQTISINVYPTDATIRYTLDGSIPSLVNGMTYNAPLIANEHTLIRAYAYKANWLDSAINSAEYFFVTANPVFSIPSGSYPDAQTLTLSTPTPGASIRYTIDGSDPTDINGILYTVPLSINTSTTVKAIAYRNGWINSNVIINAYIINGPVSNPVFSVNGGDYYVPFAVTISAIPSNATIYYTLDGSAPSDVNGFVYAAPVNINAGTTLSARAYLNNWQPSGVTTAIYNMITSPVAFNPPGGTYAANQLVTLSTINAAPVIYYTLNGSDPVIGISAIFDPLSPILVANNLMIKAIAQVAGWSPSIITSATYVINIPLPVVATPQIDPPSGVFTSPQNVMISVSTPDAVIIFTTDGSEPTLLNGTVYTASFTVSVSSTIKARAFKAGWDPSTIATAQYIIVIPIQTVAAPVFNPPAGIYGAPVNVLVSSATAGASIRYTLDGTEPSETFGTIYADPINIASTTTIKAIAYKVGMNTSMITNSSYVINIIIPAVEAPVFSIPSDTYQSVIDVAITSSTSDAGIRYTTDGSNPSPTFGTIYTGAINVPENSSLFIKAIAYKDGWTPSQIV